MRRRGQLPKNFVERELCRYDCYRLLSVCYCVPGPELVAGDPVDRLVGSLDGVYPEMTPFGERMRAALAGYTESEVLLEYSRLFLGPLQLIAPPYGSVYLEEGRRVMGESTLDVVRFYRETGLSLDPEQNDMPDHIAVALEFMSVVVHQTLAAYQASDAALALGKLKIQRAFVQRHIGLWVPPFARAINDGTKNSFYARLADCTDAFVRRDKEHLEQTAPDDGEVPFGAPDKS